MKDTSFTYTKDRHVKKELYEHIFQ